MNDIERMEHLQESIDSHRQGMRHDMGQFLSDAALSGVGLVTIGVGIGFALKGELSEAGACITVGAGVATIFGESAKEEFDNYQEERDRLHRDLALSHKS